MAASNRLFQLCVSALLVILIAAPLNLVHAESLGQWTSTTKYPLGLNAVSCANFASDIYCVGGVGGGGNSHNQVYLASLGASGIGAWSTGAAYPTAIDSASCVSASAGIYCVGGENGGNPVNNVYFAPASSSGLGSWSSAAPYPNSLAAISCVAYSGYIYCVGGFDTNGDEVSSTYYAPISSGLTSWTGTTQYPLAVDSASCAVSGGDIYCVAGETENGASQNTPITNVYYAQLTSSGIGQWSTALSYPTALAAASCAPYSGYLYCVGGFDSSQYSSTDTYFAAVNASGVASWANAAPYPIAIDTSTCVTYNGYIYCVGGTSDTASSHSIVNSSYYAPIAGAATTSSTTPEFPVAAAIPLVLAGALVAVAWTSRTTRRSSGPTA